MFLFLPFHSVCLTVVSPPHFHSRGISTWSMCIGAKSCLHGFTVRSPGSWLGGSRVSALCFFCFGTLRPIPVMFCLLLLIPMDGLLGIWHTSCHLFTTFHCGAMLMSQYTPLTVSSPLWFLFLLRFVFVARFVFGSCFVCCWGFCLLCFSVYSISGSYA